MTTDLFGNVRHVAQEGDKVYTPDWCAQDMVDHFHPSGRILEPCKGGGAFLRALLNDTFWCEIDEGVDFFDWVEPVDWIITNPPYSILKEFFVHSMSVTNNIVFLFPPRNYFSAFGFVSAPRGWGALKEIRWYGGGSRLKFPMGNAIAALHWQKDFQGEIFETWAI